jgi:2,4-dienoyl-CoA reductase-like NADH-dependent reductase (Old Yellow Enzyme family)
MEQPMPQNRASSENLLDAPIALPSGEVLRNRLAKAAMSETLATYDNHATTELVTLYKRWSDSGAGLIITGNIMVDRRAIGEPRNVVIEDEADLPILQQWADAATSKGVAIWAQLNHPGKQSTKGLNAETISASAVPFREDMEGLFATPREATVAEIE